jgi:transposase
VKTVYSICCGVDVHKKQIVATIATTDKNNITLYETKTFSTFLSDLIRFRTWLSDHNCFHVCMESTGRYWIPIFGILEDSVHVVLTHPKYVRAIKGKKTDKRDSKWIVNLFKHDLVRSSFIPPKDIRALRDLARYRFKLVSMRRSEKNRYQDCMTVSNISVANVLTDPFGKTSMGIMGHLLSSGIPDDEFCKTLIKGTAKKKTDQILESIKGCRIAPEQNFKMTEARMHMEFLDQMILRTEARLYALVRPHYGFVESISGLPGLTPLSATLIIAEIGADMSVFESSKHLVSWAGLSPANNESAGKKKSTRISKAGQFLKPLLIQCALTAVRSKKEPYFAVKYQNIKRRRGHKKAIVAVARMMLVCIYNMMQTGEMFNPSDYVDVTSPRPRKQMLTDKTVFAYLEEQGYDTSVLVKKTG